MTFEKLLYQLWLPYCILFSIFLVGCSREEPEGKGPLGPSELQVTVEIIGSGSGAALGDGSGQIHVNFSAKNASSYKVNFGNGDIIETESENLSYKYKGKGIHTYHIYISAYKGLHFVTAKKSVKIMIAPAIVWSDEFNYQGAPDSSKWEYDTGASGWGNNEKQHYTSRSENVRVENGILRITARRENFEGSQYTSARIKTQSKFNFRYGKVEVRAKLPEGSGTWPAIWMLGANITSVGWPGCGEIDIAEHLGNEPGKIHAAVHTPASFGATINSGTTNVADAQTAFHIYAVEWTAEKIKFSIDDSAFYSYMPSEKNSSTWPFNENQFIVLNIAMGGNFGGEIGPEFNSGTMEVDYVRVFQ